MLIRDIQVFNKESNALDTWDQSANTCILIAFQLMFYLIEKKNFEMINNKKKIIFMHINDIRRVLNGRADILKIRIMLQFFFMIFSF